MFRPSRLPTVAWRAALAAGLAIALTAGLAAAQATVPRLAEQLTDEIRVLSASEAAEVRRALDAVEADTGVQVWVLFTDVTGGEPAPAFADRTAEANSLGANDALLVVAFEDRVYALWASDRLELSDRQLDDILADVLEPRLRADDPAGAAIATARAVGEAVTGGVPATPVPTAVATPRPQPTAAPGGSTGGGGLDLTPVIAIVVLGGGALLIVRGVVVARQTARLDARDRDKLAREANRALLAVDELLLDAEQELGFAEAEWGDAEAKPFRDGVLAATAELKAAFAIRQLLDDHIPEPPTQRRVMLAEIMDRTGRARTMLETELTRIEERRDLERTAPTLLAALPAEIEVLRTRRTAAGALLDRLLHDYAPSAVGSVSGNLVEADKCLETAASETARGLEAVEPRRGEAVVALRHAQEGVASAARLVEGVERLAASLDDAAAQAGPELAAAEADVARARAAIGSGGAGAGLTEAVARAERLLGEAQRSAQATPYDPLVALDRATAAHRAADEALSGIEAAEQARLRQAQLLDRTIVSARGRVARAADYITTRRHGVGERARVRAAEAEARLAEAERLAPTDAAAALAAANRSLQLADEAYSLAASEFDGWTPGGGPVAGPYRGGGPSPEAQIAGAILGGIIGGVIGGGGRRSGGSGWGGSSWGGSGGGNRSGGFGLPSGPRGGGSRSGGGSGGRARGGRW